jgi:Uncharacterised protein family (UPF0236)
LRDAFFGDARRLIEGLLNDRGLIADKEPPRPLESLYEGRTRRVQTLFGPIELRRRYYHHRAAHSGRCPLDETLDLVRGCTSALARLICRASSVCGSYQEAAREISAYTGLQLESRHFGRLVAEVAPILREAHATLAPSTESPLPILYVCGDGTGVPMRKEETLGRKGKAPDGSARTREVKLGCVFSQTTTDENGQPLRDPDSTTYVATFQGCRAAGTLLREEALRRGYARAQQTVCLGDGALWVWENCRINFPDAVEILDFYHASEHVGLLSAALFGAGTPKAKERQGRWCHQMKEQSAQLVIDQARKLAARLGNQLDALQRESIEAEIGYFKSNATRTRYGEFRARGFFIGSGVVEAGCKTVVGRRLKQSGMFWSQRGAEDLLGLRCLLLGPHFDAAWKARTPILATRRQKARRWSASPN